MRSLNFRRDRHFVLSPSDGVGGTVLATDNLPDLRGTEAPYPHNGQAAPPSGKSLFDTDFDGPRPKPQGLPFLQAMSRMGIALSVFLALLIGVSFPFLHTMTLRVVDAMAGALVALLFLISTVGIRIAQRIANRLLDGAKS